MQLVRIDCWLVDSIALQKSVQLAGNGALEAAADLALALALGGAAAGVGPGRLVMDLISSWAALMGPIPGWVSRAGAMTVTSWRSSPSSWWASCRAVRTRWAVRARARTVARCSTGSLGVATSPAQAWTCWRQGRPRRVVRRSSGAVTIRALSWRRASAPAWTMPARGCATPAGPPGAHAGVGW
jgi:glutamate synthase domain-containing protein 2